jgi:hypothetical protein
MTGCKYCRDTVRKHTDIQPDEICFVCDAPLHKVGKRFVARLFGAIARRFSRG